VITVLEYLVIAAAIGLLVFLIAVFVFGRGEQMAALSPRTSPSELPEGPIGGDDVRRIRFGLALRGYRMSDVDWTLDRLSDELDRLHRRVAELGGEPLPPGVGPDPAAPDLFVGEPDAGREAGGPGAPGSRPDAGDPRPDQPGTGHDAEHARTDSSSAGGVPPSRW
jgi:DivIVA domain-containing protein